MKIYYINFQKRLSKNFAKVQMINKQRDMLQNKGNTKSKYMSIAFYLAQIKNMKY